jgi:hypothetical protein
MVEGDEGWRRSTYIPSRHSTSLDDEHVPQRLGRKPWTKSDGEVRRGLHRRELRRTRRKFDQCYLVRTEGETTLNAPLSNSCKKTYVADRLLKRAALASPDSSSSAFEYASIARFQSFLAKAALPSALYVEAEDMIVCERQEKGQSSEGGEDFG